MPDHDYLPKICSVQLAQDYNKSVNQCEFHLEVTEIKSHTNSGQPNFDFPVHIMLIEAAHSISVQAW